MNNLPSFARGFGNDEPFPTGSHRIALPKFVGYKKFGDISVAVQNINEQFGTFGHIDYLLDDNQYPGDLDTPLAVNGLVRAYINDQLMKPNPDIAYGIRKELLDEIVAVNFFRESVENSVDEIFTASNTDEIVITAFRSFKFAEIAKSRIIPIIEFET